MQIDIRLSLPSISDGADAKSSCVDPSSCLTDVFFHDGGAPLLAKDFALVLVASKIPKLYKIFHHIEPLNACMKY